MAKTKVKVPKLGLTIETVTITEWTKSIGDAVAAGEQIGTVEADKAAYEIESPVQGTIIELMEADQETEYSVGDIIAVIDAG